MICFDKEEAKRLLMKSVAIHRSIAEMEHLDERAEKLEDIEEFLFKDLYENNDVMKCADCGEEFDDPTMGVKYVDDGRVHTLTHKDCGHTVLEIETGPVDYEIGDLIDD